MVAENSEEVFARQIRYIQGQLNNDAPDDDGPPSDDEEEFEDIDEEGEDVDGDEADEYEATDNLLRKVANRGTTSHSAIGPTPLMAFSYCTHLTFFSSDHSGTFETSCRSAAAPL